MNPTTNLPLFIERLYGVEIVEGATNIEKADFKGGACAFMMGNEVPLRTSHIN
jgi:hypothetical protein